MKSFSMVCSNVKSCPSCFTWPFVFTTSYLILYLKANFWSIGLLYNILYVIFDNCNNFRIEKSKMAAAAPPQPGVIKKLDEVIFKGSDILKIYLINFKNYLPTNNSVVKTRDNLKYFFVLFSDFVHHLI